MAEDRPVNEFDTRSFARQRQSMVQSQLYRRGIRDREVLEAFRQVQRHCFVPAESRSQSYADYPLPIGSGQTISQPYVVAYMLQALQIQPADRVLEIGTGSGYQTALLAELVEEVYTIEFFSSLATATRQTLTGLGYTNIELRVGDGTAGWPEKAPFDAIIGSAAAAKIPPALIEQLALGGRLILPVGEFQQNLVLICRTSEGVQRTPLLPVRFVPMQTGTP